MKRLTEKTQALALLSVIALVSFLTGCASIFNGSNQQVDVMSTPTQASVVVNGESMGESPTKLTLERGKEYTIEIKKDGFSKYIVTTGRNINSNYWLNFLNGIGFLVDWATGAMWEVDPTTVEAVLDPATSYNQIERKDEFTAINVRDKAGKLLEHIDVDWK